MKAPTKRWVEGVRCDNRPGVGRNRSGDAKPSHERADYLLAEDMLVRALRQIPRRDPHEAITAMSWDQLAVLQDARLAMQAVCLISPAINDPESISTTITHALADGGSQ